MNGGEHAVGTIGGAIRRARIALRIAAGMGIMGGVFVTAQALLLLERAAARAAGSSPADVVR